jgi:acetyltransferase-like isoleucine patch superfamily enzyme
MSGTEVTYTDVGIVDADLGKDVRIMRPVNIYGCRIGDRTFIGPFCEIQRNVAIGSDCRIQSHSFICELVTIGDRCFIGHGAMFVNDLFAGGGPARGNRARWLPTNLGDDVSIGSNATVLPVRIVDGVVVGAGAVVTHDLLVKGSYAGNPARLLRTL